MKPIHSWLLPVAPSLVLVASASFATTPAPTATPTTQPWASRLERVEREVERIAGDFRSVARDLADSRKEVSSRLTDLRQDLVRVEKAVVGTAAAYKLRLQEFAWADLVGFLTVFFAGVGSAIAYRRYFSERANEQTARSEELERNAEEQRWKRMEFIFQFALEFHADAELSEMLARIDQQLSQRPLNRALSAYNLGSPHDDFEESDGQTLRQLDRLLNRLELIAKAWEQGVLTEAELGVFGHYLRTIGDPKFPQLQQYATRYYPLIVEAANATSPSATSASTKHDPSPASIPE